MIVKYVNHLGEEVNLNRDPYKMLISDLLDYEHDTVEDSGKIRGFGYSVKKRNVGVDVHCTNSRTARQNQNDLTQFFEQDILAASPGKLYVNDQYMKCFVVSCEKSNWETPVIVSCEYSIKTDFPFWIEETPYSFGISEDYSGNNKRYGYRYAYRYANGLTGCYIINDHYNQADFRMVIYGPVVNPLVIIDGHRYLVNILLEAGEYLEIDSAAGTVLKVMNSGQIVNAFHNRDKGDKGGSIFQPILPGRRTVEWSGEFAWDIILYAKRSEPLWQ